ncbi:MAG: ThiF family adenylyltransferase [Thermotogae bacterium]|nr:ThiF family adenylyltransferase [Thermotogota bacterium]
MRMAIIGAGGLGLSALKGLLELKMNLSNEIVIFDFDRVEESNIHRQIFYTINDLGKSKIQVLKERFSSVENLRFFEMKLNDENVENLKCFNLILLCVDNAETRFIVNDFCVKNKISFIEAGVEEFVGTVFIYVPEETACYRCFHPVKPLKKEKPGIITFTNVLAGFYQAKEAFNFLNGKSKLIGKLFHFDLKSNIFEYIKLSKNPKCPVCSVS